MAALPPFGPASDLTFDATPAPSPESRRAPDCLQDGYPKLSAPQSGSSAAATIAGQVADAFALVRAPEHQWARDFLFDTSPAASAQMLTNPAALRHSITTSVCDNIFSPHSNETAAPSLHDVAIDSQFLFVPVFSANDLSVGVLAHAVSPASFSPSPGAHQDLPPSRRVHSGTCRDIFPPGRSSASLHV
jgi:hypothetical protein